MTEQEVLTAQVDVFYPALINRDWEALSLLYAADYSLVRSDGTTLDKVGVLSDLRSGTLVFKSIELRNARVRIIGSVGILTGESRIVVEHNGVESQSHIRLTAVYTETDSSIHLLHFQSTDIANG